MNYPGIPINMEATRDRFCEFIFLSFKQSKISTEEDQNATGGLEGFGGVMPEHLA